MLSVHDCHADESQKRARVRNCQSFTVRARATPNEFIQTNLLLAAPGVTVADTSDDVVV